VIILAGALFSIATLANPDQALIARAQKSIARADALVAHGDFDAALRVAHDADEIGLHAASEEIRGAVAEARDSLREAAEHYARALEFAERAGSSPLMASAAEGLARTYGQQGRIDLTLALANRMLEKDPANRALYLFERGVAYSSLNEPAAAQQAFDESLPLAETAGDLKLIAQLHRHRGLWIWRYARDYARRAKDWRIVVLTLTNYGNSFRNREVNRLPEALRRYNEGLAIARREHLGYQIAYLLRNIGNVYRRQGDGGRAEAVLLEAARMADRTDVPDVRWLARNELGMLLHDRDPIRAEHYFHDAIDIVESEQSDVLLEDFRPGALADSIRFFNPYDQLIDLLLAQHRPQEAFFIAERQRARAFLETLTASRDTLAREVPAAFSKSERQILDRIKTAQAALRSDSLTDAKRSELVAAVGLHESELSDLRLKLAVEHPSLAHARFPKLWQVSEIQSKLLAPDESLLALYLGEKRSVAWVITRERLDTVFLPPRDEIERRARPALLELRNPLARDHAALNALSRALEVDAISKLGGSKPRMVIVPHGILYDIPFEALVDPAGHPLVERFAVSYAPSASSLSFLRSLPARARAVTTLVAVANPIVGGTGSATKRQVDLAHINLLQPVAQSSEEAHAIAHLFVGSRVLEGAQATRSEFRRLNQARMLHFATHGLIDENVPDRSGLVLTADPPRDDGLLQVRDIYSLRLNADLVTLSACETALGQNVNGEGMIGLTRAFFYAGARSVVASLWDVEDTATSRLMQQFYKNIRHGEPIDIALQRAKLDFLHAGGPTSAPFYWAAFIVSGQAHTPIDIPQPSYLPVGIATAAVLLLGAVLYYRGRMVNVRR
jgi:CHAT domain-containing protein